MSIEEVENSWESFAVGLRAGSFRSWAKAVAKEDATSNKASDNCFIWLCVFDFCYNCQLLFCFTLAGVLNAPQVTRKKYFIIDLQGINLRLNEQSGQSCYPGAAARCLQRRGISHYR
jgi:hypothetical protein